MNLLVLILICLKNSYSQFMGDNAMDQDSKNQNTGFSEYYVKFPPLLLKQN